ncbi:MAG: hypothetical protein MJ133_07630 [Lachnospiraceae bacterium]|nr:hypothetical protein [Lachnospiraceae bacterium]
MAEVKYTKIPVQLNNRRKEVLALNSVHMPVEQIAAFYNVPAKSIQISIDKAKKHKDTVYAIKKINTTWLEDDKADRIDLMQKDPFYNLRVEKAEELLGDGWSCNQVEEYVGLSAYMASFCQNAPKKKEKKKNIFSVRQEELAGKILEDYKAGISQSQIAAKNNVSRQSVVNYLKIVKSRLSEDEFKNINETRDNSKKIRKIDNPEIRKPRRENFVMDELVNVLAEECITIDNEVVKPDTLSNERLARFIGYDIEVIRKNRKKCQELARKRKMEERKLIANSKVPEEPTM